MFGIYLIMAKIKERGIAFFEGKNIRRYWDDKKELWYFSVVDVVGVLSDSVDPRKYWNKLAERLRKEGSESVTKCHQLKMLSSDGKKYLTDVADTETLFRLIQSIPSPNAEPFKLWLAKVGYERLEETADPELAINRALKTYFQKGYSPEWINLRLKSIEIRKGMTDEWERGEVKEGYEYALLTNEITKAWAGLTARQYKNLKGLTKENLKDNMSNTELVLNMLAETATTEISKVKSPKGFDQNKKVAREGGAIAGGARKNLEKRLGRSIVTKQNFLK